VYTLIDVLIASTDSSGRSSHEKTMLQLAVHPSSGVSTENIQVRCHITVPASNAPFKYDNVYLSVKTDNVIPSGILLMVDHRLNQCRINREKYIHVQICNRSLVLIHISHTILNDSLHTIDYACSKGDVNAMSSYRIASKPHIIDRKHQFNLLLVASSRKSHGTRIRSKTQ
jgi:hypothetical protein